MLCLISIAFFMAPNPFACFSRKILFPVAVITIFGPIAVKSICIWHADLLTARGEHRQAAIRHSVLTFWICAAIIMVQTVISSEWAMFESALDLIYVVSERHGNAWRCTPGNDSWLLREVLGFSLVLTLLEHHLEFILLVGSDDISFSP
ncbi:unnamed protein product [Cylicostephanus goldi]|uniref:G-protein coupled receptors family 3 profile domain-containing protein n=1 Tax=Cylicostephanus goldi TaxID=71465 RepID=A0A3P7N5P8_CYLGO|nr:unnamed protein product [Cylicostephanus goldi]